MNKFHLFDPNDTRLEEGKDYLILTFDNKYHIAEFTKGSFFGFPLFVKAWSEFDRYKE